MTSIRIEDGQGFIKCPMQTLGFNPNPLGVCNGIAGAYIQDDVLGKRAKFNERLEIIRDKEKLEKYLKEQPLCNEWNEVLDFFKTITCYQNREKCEELSKLESNPYDMEAISKLIGSPELKEQGGLATVYLDEVMYTPVEWCGYLDKLRSIFQIIYSQTKGLPFKLSMKISLRFDGPGHALVLSYDEINNQWILADPSHLPAFAIRIAEKSEQSKLDSSSEVWKQQPETSYQHIVLMQIIHLCYNEYLTTKYIPGVIQVLTVRKHPNLTSINKLFDNFKKTNESYCAPLNELIKRVGKNGHGLVHLAAEANDVERIQEIMKAGGDILQCSDNVSALYKLVTYRSAKSLSFLSQTESKINFDQLSQEGFSPAFVAAQYDYYEILEILGKAKADLGKPCKQGMTPLHVAAQQNSLSALKILINPDYNICLNCTNDLGRTPLFYAAINNHFLAIEILATAGADLMKPGLEGALPQHVAAQEGSIEALKSILKPESKVDFDKSINDGSTAIYIAAGHNRPEVIRLLVNAGADIHKTNNDGWLPLHVAAQHGHTKILETILQLYPTINLNITIPTGENAAFIAAQHNHFEFIKLLAENKADMNIPRKIEGMTAMHAAAYFGGLQSVKVLQDWKCYSLQEDNEGYTPLNYAITQKHFTVAAHLLKNIHIGELNAADKKLLRQNKTQLLPFLNLSKSSLVVNVGFFKAEQCITDYLTVEPPTRCTIC